MNRHAIITPRVISLDLDDTLWPAAAVIAAAERDLSCWLTTHHPRAMHGHDADTLRALRARVAAQFPQHCHDLTFLRREALAAQFAAAGHLPAARVAAAVDEALEIFFVGRNRVECYADVRPALLRLRTKYRLFALSNGNADLRRCGIAEFFDGHITAAAAGAAKPDPLIFARLACAAGVAPIEVLHIGDDPLADVVGATRAGMQAAWLNRDARTWPSQYGAPLRTVATLAEID